MVAVSASAAIVMVLMVVVTVAFAVIAAATFMAQVIQHVLYLLIRGQTVFQHDASELQRLSCQRMVGVKGHAVFVHIRHSGHKAALLIVLEGDDGSGEDVVVVKMAIDSKILTAHMMHTLFKVFAEGLGRWQGEVKLLTGLHIDEPLLKTVKRESESADKREGLALLCLFLQMALAVAV